MCAQHPLLLLFSIAFSTLKALRIISTHKYSSAMQVYNSIHRTIYGLCVSKAHIARCYCIPARAVITFYPSSSIFLRLKRMRRTIFRSARNLSFRVKLFNRLPSSFSTFQWHLMESVLFRSFLLSERNARFLDKREI